MIDFTVADRESQTWQKIREHLTERLDEFRKRNDGRMTEADREQHLGRIAEMKDMLAWEEPVPEMPPVGLHH